MFTLLFIGTVISTVIIVFLVWLQSKARSEKEGKEEAKKTTGTSISDRFKDWKNFIPSWIPAHAWQFLIALIVAYGIIWGLSPTTWHKWFSNGNLFWFVSIGGLLLSIFFDFKKKSSIAVLLFAVLFLNILGMDQKSVDAFFEKKKEPQKVVKEEVQYRLGEFSVIAPRETWGEIVHIPRGARWEFESRPNPIKVMRVNTGEVYRIEKDTDVSIPSPTYAVRFQSTTQEDVEVRLVIQNPR